VCKDGRAQCEQAAAKVAVGSLQGRHSRKRNPSPVSANIALVRDDNVSSAGFGMPLSPDSAFVSGILVSSLRKPHKSSGSRPIDALRTFAMFLAAKVRDCSSV
jgi:hypothetical protein